jgi:hypothetical protein
VKLSILNLLRLLNLRYFSKPIADRPIYRAICRHRVQKIVELGIGDGRRALRMIQAAQLASKRDCPNFRGQHCAAKAGENGTVPLTASRSPAVQYVGMDLFEGRRDCPDFRGQHCATKAGENGTVPLTASEGQEGLSLKAAHQLLRSADATVRLVPGNPADGLIRMANTLGKIDLLIVPAELDSPAFARMWFFVPRMLHKHSLVYVEGLSADGQRELREKHRDEIDRLAAAGSRPAYAA